MCMTFGLSTATAIHITGPKVVLAHDRSTKCAIASMEIHLFPVQKCGGMAHCLSAVECPILVLVELEGMHLSVAVHTAGLDFLWDIFLSNPSDGVTNHAQDRLLEVYLTCSEDAPHYKAEMVK